MTFHILNAKYVNSLRDKVCGLQNNESVSCEKDFFFQRPLYKKNHFSCYHAKIPDKGILVSLFVLAHSLEVHMSRRHGDYKWWLASHTVSGVKKKKEMSVALLWFFPSPFLSVWDSNFWCDVVQIYDGSSILSMPCWKVSHMWGRSFFWASTVPPSI